MTTIAPITPWARRIGAAAVLTLGVGLTAAMPATASAAPIQCTPQARAAVHAQVAPEVAQVLAHHPDLAAEITHLKTLPRNERKAQFHAYASNHREEVKELHHARKALRQYRKACRAH